MHYYNTTSLCGLCGLHNSPFRHSFLSNLSSHESLAGKLWRSISQFLEKKIFDLLNFFTEYNVQCKRFAPNFPRLWNTEMRNVIQFALFCNSYILSKKCTNPIVREERGLLMIKNALHIMMQTTRKKYFVPLYTMHTA